MDDYKLIIGCIMGCVFIMVLWGFYLRPDLGNYYKQGQIDYANDIIKYELREQDNHEYIWVKKEGN